MGHHPVWSLLPTLCKYQLILHHSCLAGNNPIFQTRTPVSEVSWPFAYSLLIQLPGALLDPWSLFLLSSFQLPRAQMPKLDENQTASMTASPGPIPCLGLCHLLPLEADWLGVEQALLAVSRGHGVCQFPPHPGRALSVFWHYHLR